ncbi:MAG: HD domain-containing protein [Verrucomicrobiota bacterium]
MPCSVITYNELIEEIIGGHKEHMGDQFLPYKNHVYRVFNFCLMFHRATSEESDKLAIAAAFHDLGMWPGDEIDYLAPSIQLAQNYLRCTERDEWLEEVTQMIEFHHRFRKSPKHFPPLVEVFRRGDWVDATKGLRRFGLPKADIWQLQREIENLGFHDNLIRIAKKEFWKRPFNPLPMMKW